MVRLTSLPRHLVRARSLRCMLRKIILTRARPAFHPARQSAHVATASPPLPLDALTSLHLTSSFARSLTGEVAPGGLQDTAARQGQGHVGRPRKVRCDDCTRLKRRCAACRAIPAAATTGTAGSSATARPPTARTSAHAECARRRRTSVRASSALPRSSLRKWLGYRHQLHRHRHAPATRGWGRCSPLASKLRISCM
jgi:hypothetical protein